MKATIYDIARLTGTTISAVSRAFNPSGKISTERRQLILDTAEKYGYRPNRAASSMSRKSIKIGFAAVANIPEYYNELISGIKSAHRRLADFKVECEIKLIPLSDSDDRGHLAMLDEFVNEGCDGILLSLLLYSPAVCARINELTGSGIPCATVTSDIPESERLFSSQNNLDIAGRMAAQLLAFLMHGRRRAVIFSGNADSFIHSRLISGFRDEAESHGVKLAGIYDTKDIPELAAECMDSMTDKYFGDGGQGIDGIYFSSANSIPAIERMLSAALPVKPAIIASDIFPELAGLIRDGTVDATIYQNPFEQARLAFDTMYGYLTERKLKQTLFTVTPQVIMKSNINLYIRQ